MNVADRIQDLLRRKLSASKVEVSDESGLHKGHQEAMKGGGHYSVFVVSDLFQDKPLIERHRQIYNALSELTSEIHALAIKAYTVQETEKLK